MDYPGTVRDSSVMQRNPVCYILSGRFARSITGLPVGG